MMLQKLQYILKTVKKFPSVKNTADLGYPQELWTMAKLHKHIQGHTAKAGFPRLETVSKTRIQQIFQELIDRIYKYFKEINADPVVFHWKYKMDEIQL